MTAVDTARPRASKPQPAWALLRETMFRRYWSAAGIAFVGDQVAVLALPLLAVLMLGATPAQMGYLTAAGLAPSLAFSVMAGLWVDRRQQRRRVMVAADVARTVLIASIPVAAVFGVLTMTQLYVVAFLVGTCAVFFEVANGTLFVSLVRPEQYVAASSLIHGARSASFVAGPSIAGVIVQVLSAPVAAGSLMAALIPHQMRARVSGLFRTVNYGVRPVGALLGGALGTLVGVRTTSWVAGIGAVLGVLWLWRSPILPMRTLPDPPI